MWSRDAFRYPLFILVFNLIYPFKYGADVASDFSDPDLEVLNFSGYYLYSNIWIKTLKVWAESGSRVLEAPNRAGSGCRRGLGIPIPGLHVHQRKRKIGKRASWEGQKLSGRIASHFVVFVDYQWATWRWFTRRKRRRHRKRRHPILIFGMMKNWYVGILE